MTRYTFDPSKLDRPGVDADKHVADMLREYLGGDPLEDARRRFGLGGTREATVGDLLFNATRLKRRPRHGKEEA
jgi:hypothetical protein